MPAHHLTPAREQRIAHSGGLAVSDHESPAIAAHDALPGNGPDHRELCSGDGVNGLAEVHQSAAFRIAGYVFLKESSKSNAHAFVCSQVLCVLLREPTADIDA